MKEITAIAGIYLAIGYFGTIPFRREKKRKELWIYIIVMIVALAMNVFLSLNIKFESISSILTRFFKGFLNLE